MYIKNSGRKPPRPVLQMGIRKARLVCEAVSDGFRRLCGVNEGWRVNGAYKKVKYSSGVHST